MGLLLHKKDPLFWNGAVLVAPMCKVISIFHVIFYHEKYSIFYHPRLKKEKNVFILLDIREGKATPFGCESTNQSGRHNTKMEDSSHQGCHRCSFQRPCKARRGQISYILIIFARIYQYVNR